MKDHSLQELRFQQRAFLNYYDFLIILKNQGKVELNPDIPVDSEISRTESRIDDLTILVKRKSIEEEEPHSQHH